MPGILLCSSIKSFSQQDQRIHAAYIIAFGRDATLSELNYWLGRGNLSIAQLINFHRQGLTEYPLLHRETINRSYIDALGHTPSEDEMKYWMNRNDIYSELMNNHLRFLKLNGWENEKVIRLSYTAVLGREPTVAEINFWKDRGGTVFFLLSAYHEYYKIKSKSEIGSDGKINLQALTSVSIVSLSPPIAAEASNFAGHYGNAVRISVPGNSVIAGTGNINTEIH